MTGNYDFIIRISIKPLPVLSLPIKTITNQRPACI